MLVLHDRWGRGAELDVAARLISGDTYRLGELKKTLVSLKRQAVANVDAPKILRAEAIILLYLAELKSGSYEEALPAAERAVRASLFQNPNDSFLWLNLYLLRNADNGFATEDAALLHESYSTGPREGWIAITRNRRALAILPFLDDANQQQVISEFAALVKARLFEVAQASMVGAGWVHRERLLAALERVDLPTREMFARALRDGGVAVRVPGVLVPDQPWRRN
ncbi:hypothetical protein I6F20_24705 [Bradyrhizobium sp. IC3123]|uniref:hypothetical protein n=1 Tax=Bradyrhizobium sp. IC3123 TaxID=2793803 RepID=UPI001CD4FC53|nr:hypothetical protein [Bradyrhizobium sp. IC3123]MCA1392277.1 hypothetical protein [Bradyrhizobium sp. IC3123]